MSCKKQVEKAHYEFNSYMSKERWISVWHQLDEIQKLKPGNVLEVGPGPGLFKIIAAAFEIPIETLDLDPDLKPDHLGSATAMPFADATYDVVCAFQMLEHLPYDISRQAFREMVRVSRRHVVISLPDARTVWRYQAHVPKFGSRQFLLPRPQLRAHAHEFDGQHYWEINKRGYPLTRVIADFSSGLRLVKTYRVHENPYHRFFVFER
ncbi:MAG: SAM-dependent methyltransferase [Acidobacteria bacterium]|nr:MAG: SAM-dependent methyltransferase [Acidobacteriota bacterium]